MIAQVIVDVVHTNVDRPFSYLIPEGMEVEQGSRVSVPLGKRRVDGPWRRCWMIIPPCCRRF